MKIIHISDLHFGAHNETIKEHFLIEMSMLSPDLIIISGDLTQRAKKEQFKALSKFIKALPAPVLAVPGNHDIPLWNGLSRLLNPFKDYHKRITPITKTQYLNTTLRALGLNSVNPFRIKNGKLSKNTLDGLFTFFEKDFKGLNLVFFHHNFDYLEGFHKPLENYEEFLDFLKQSSIHVVCTGHLHYAHASIITKQNGKPCLILHAGSLLSNRTKDNVNSYYLLETQNLSCTISWKVYNQNQFEIITKYQVDLTKPNSVLTPISKTH
ncbi:metallophosphoesterase family protein [Legionella impletisoli]|uniref:3',5'-cyclic-nucleotide phosphodiesterase n=1 Tax=Legionella impletisoli TaxID=343510 RepID=A0A917JZL4_9GAMM|nr:metallophosphoesterase [Legionella impletisoli]GGI92137.1 3',5'-cyclic-nucleotide phosphodiesterase [Legionella impletisoli]